MDADSEGLLLLSDDGRWNAGVVVSGPLGTVAKVDFGEWEHYAPCGYEDTPCYPCEGWPIATNEKTEFDDFARALTNAWDCGVSYEQAIELAPLAAMSREEFDAEMDALDAASLAALEADARANP